uniref:Putative aldo/keto reductase family n=1 Tax=Amblyomma triste TaxID=251400 RepID=A0A023GHU9_AMBTT
MALSVATKVLLNNGAHLPAFGFGTYRISEAALKSLLPTVLQKGYRLIDSAPLYRNEAAVVATLQSLPQYGLQRSDIWVASKMPPVAQGTEKCRESVLGTLQRLGGRLDLMLLHWPGVQGRKPADPEQAALRKESWLELENLYNQGKVGTIGVSNYTVRHLQELLTYCSVPPAVNQVEFHPHLVQTDLLQFCKEHHIVLQAYSSLGAADGVKAVLQEPTIVEIAGRHQKTPAQVVLRWALQLGIAIIPKSSNAQRIEENAQIFDFSLTEDDIAAISSLNKNKHYCWDPTHIA